MFVNTLVLRTEVDAADEFTRHLARARDAALGAFGHADVPFERLVEVLNPERSTARHPLFQVMLSFENLRASRIDLRGLTLDVVDIDSAVAKFDLQLTLTEAFDGDGAPNGLGAAFTYATDLFDAATAHGFADRFVRVLETVVADPAVRVGDIDLLDGDERSLVLERWNDTAHEVESSSTLVDLFEAQVRRTPGAVALEFEGRSLTFAEFDSRVNRVARHLVSVGVGPESTVGLAMRRSLDLLVGMYAIVKAGGAYVPVDPDQPRIVMPTFWLLPLRLWC